ncbi:BsuBI/PstI family type II restriction endonuclease [Acinetobacter sp. AG1]|nr:BsuBI/PstI family type II restriction endonuclease [Acinetobacter sp. AG1]
MYVTAFPDRAIMRKYLGDIAWETEVWVGNNSKSPTNLYLIS